ncbi:choice-of-anchor Q domain-containing protein [Marinicella sp. W31]|uniref:choice-of-anchor Q domain-containing protein n=1 Tax=Marinicella sp. W31 TaxID=3023713 RepID=UPI00375689EC
MIKKMFKQKIFVSIAQVLCITTVVIQLTHAGDLPVIVVDSTADQTTPGLTTFREAIEQANLLSESEIIFDQNIFSTPQVITLENGEIPITSNTIITGPGADLLTIDADNLSRILNIRDGNNTDARVVITGMTFANGNSSAAGGCINSSESLRLRATVITACFSERNGGGLHNVNADNVLIENSSFINNTSGNNGGGLFIQRQDGHRIINSTFSGNIASRNGGGITSNNTVSMNVLNSTFSDNLATKGAGVFADSSITITHSTIINNTGPGVQLIQDNIQNSIIADNTGFDCVFGETGINNQYNLDTDGSCGVDAVNHTTVADPLLGPLADNGGFTMTHLPQEGSPVIDAASDEDCAINDQRGVSRPQDGDGDGDALCDIGSVEVVDFGDLIFKDGFDELFGDDSVTANNVFN